MSAALGVAILSAVALRSGVATATGVGFADGYGDGSLAAALLGRVALAAVPAVIARRCTDSRAAALPCIPGRGML